MEDNQQKPQQSFLQPIVSDAHQRNLILNIINPEDIIMFIENTLCGMKQDSNGEWVDDPLAKKLNKVGVYKILQVLRGHLNKYQTLANLEVNDIKRMGRDIRWEIIETIYMDWEDFNYVKDLSGKPDLSIYGYIVHLIDHNVFSNLTRAKNGAENKLLRTVYKSVEQGSLIERNVENPNRGGGVWSRLFSKRGAEPPQPGGYDGGGY